MNDPIEYEVNPVSDTLTPAVARRLDDGRIIVDVDETLPDDEQQAAIEAALHPYKQGWRQALPLLLIADGWEVAASWVRDNGQAVTAVSGAAAVAVGVTVLSLTGTVDRGAGPEVLARTPGIVASTSRTAARPERTVKHGPPDRGDSPEPTRPPATRRQEPPGTPQATPPPPTAARKTSRPTATTALKTYRPTPSVEATAQPTVKPVVERTPLTVAVEAELSPTVDLTDSPAEPGTNVEAASCGGIHVGLPPVLDVCID